MNNGLRFFTTKVLDSQGDGTFMEAYRNYQWYLNQNKSKLPRTVFDMVTSDWYFNARDPKCPKDAWVIQKKLDNDYCPIEREKKPAQFEITLLGAYHDCRLHFIYKSVVEVDAPDYGGSLLEKNYGDWRIDEFSVSDDGFLIHKIYFITGKLWTIKCKDVEFKVTSL